MESLLKMPEGYTLIRWGLWRWGWMRQEDSHFSIGTKFTAKGAIEYAARHARLMKEDQRPVPPSAPNTWLADTPLCICKNNRWKTHCIGCGKPFRPLDKQEELSARIRNYLGNGGLFNPELMEADKVRNLIMDCGDYLQTL